MAKVYYTKRITPEKLIEAYEKLGVELKGKIGVKVSTGEQGAKGYLKADLIGPFAKKLNGTILECNTAYPGERNNAKDHMKVAEAHGFTSFADVDIMDAEGEFEIPVHHGKHLKVDIIGDHFKKYDSIVNLAHAKGHMMGGFGANLKTSLLASHLATVKLIFTLVVKLKMLDFAGCLNTNKSTLLNPWPKPLLPLLIISKKTTNQLFTSPS